MENDDKIKIYCLQKFAYQIIFIYHNIKYYICLFNSNCNNSSFYLTGDGADYRASQSYCNNELKKDPKITKIINMYKLGILKKGMEI